MAIDSPQKKKGTQFLPDNRGSDKGSPASVPHTGSEGKDVLTSTNYPFKGENPAEDKGGPRNQEGQERRGYVLDSNAYLGGPIDDATVAPDGTRRVKKIG